MRKAAILLFLPVLIFATDFTQTGVAGSFVSGTDTLFNGVPYDVGRGILGGTDLDGDGNEEVWITSYSEGGRVYCFEEAGTDTLAFVWASDTLNSDYTTPRDIHTGDTDGDGNGEIIFFTGRYNSVSSSDNTANNTDNGLHIYEYDGTDNGYSTHFQAHMLTALNDSLRESRVEGFSVADIDSDGKDEILVASNGQSNPQWGTDDGSTAYSEDRFLILGVTGDIGGIGAALTTEYAMSPRDVNKDGTRGNSLGGGSPQDIVVCDTDGDGNMEAVCISWNNLAVFFLEATDTNSYTIGDTNYLKLAVADDWTLGAAAADMDGDGKDEVYIPGYYDGKIFVITDADGDATSLDTTGQGAKDWAGNSEVAILAELGAYAGNGVAARYGLGVIMGGAADTTDIRKFTYGGSGSVIDSSNWTHMDYAMDDATTGSVLKTGIVDMDGDGYFEVLLPYKALNDTTSTGDLDPAGNRVFRIAEWGTYLSVRDLTIIMPEDYKLKQNYPNPFNPNTTIEYTMPVANVISLTIYNMLGQEVLRLVDNERKDSGKYSVLWNGQDTNGKPVSSGTYFYELRFGNLSKVRQMTLIK